MLKNLFFVLALLGLLAGGYLLLSNKAKTGIGLVKETPSPAPTIAKSGISIILSEKNNSGETGLASIVERNNKIQIDINLVGPPFIQQRAVILSGTCMSPGSIKFSLKNVFNGDSLTNLDLNIEKFNTLLPMAMVVYKSEEPSVVVSCGNIKK